MSIEKLNALADKKWDLEAAVRKVNDETKVIKYDNIPSEIYINATNIAQYKLLSRINVCHKRKHK